jgi:hypothetical protein
MLAPGWLGSAGEAASLTSGERRGSRLRLTTVCGGSFLARRGGRADECGGLENRYPSLGGSRVRIPPPPLNQAVPGKEAASVRVRAVSQTATRSPCKSVDVSGSPLISLVTGARVAHDDDAPRSPERQLLHRGTGCRGLKSRSPVTFRSSGFDEATISLDAIAFNVHPSRQPGVGSARLARYSLGVGGLDAQRRQDRQRCKRAIRARHRSRPNTLRNGELCATPRRTQSQLLRRRRGQFNLACA